MNVQYLLLNLLFRQKKIERNCGFTLIELLVVVIVIGVLSAIALPNFLGQVGKFRESEAKSNLGAIARSQQAYHFETKVFADTLDKLGVTNAFVGSYYDFPDADIATNSIVKQRAISTDSINNATRDYAIGIYYSTGAYKFAFCQAANIGTAVEAPNIAEDSCSNGGFKIN